MPHASVAAHLPMWQIRPMSAELTSGRLAPGDDLSAWDGLLARSAQASIFARAWWLEAVCPGEWEIRTLHEGGRLVAGLPLTAGPRGVRPPLLTQLLGPVLSPSQSAQYEKALSHEMNLLGGLAEAVADVPRVSLHWHPSLTNWLPFHWAGYEQTTRYTYAFDDLSDLDAVFGRFAHQKRKNLARAAATVTVHADLPVEAFFAHHVQTLAIQGQAIHYGLPLLRRIHDAAVERGLGRTWYALDATGAMHAAIFVVWDQASAYYLVSTIDPAHRNSGATTLLVRHAIEQVAPHTRRFDFEGSMIAGVEQSFRKFGARQTPYYRVWRDTRPAWARSVEIGEAQARRAVRWLRALSDRR